MKRTKITDKITYVEPDSMANFTSCAGMILLSKQKILIDMNMGTDEIPKLLEQEKPDAAMITHYHLDHSTWTRQVNTYTDAVVFIPEGEEPYLTSTDFVIEHTAGAFGMSKPWTSFVVDFLGYEPLNAYESCSETTSFKDMAPEMVLINTPGHSPSHTSFYFPEDKILFSGDMGLDRFGPWYGWADCSIKKLVESILRLEGMDIELILTSHGGVVKKEIQHAWASGISTILQREKKIIQNLDKGMETDDIIRQGVFFSDKEKVSEPMRSFLYMWDTAMYNHHESLINEGGLIKFFPEILTLSTVPYNLG
ncbi:MBL fold metallo-hydrolase [Desulfobacula toluolica]|uniref:Beta-lactamase domain protein n=1 Tax=Desulfobacula toluolica (strain DSM 7467 / Tol2) TaxID=651182 RepID=K0NC04_DESTT|nr:MBL fold metallo-hydrolase [Desulfobacula toluolica]CCK78271.1 beta-lactamase domain protein [Desulfobacula toluolica Tol2]